MKTELIIRAWKDRRYRNSLTATELSLMDVNPAAAIDEDELALVTGEGDTEVDVAADYTGYIQYLSLGCCPGGMTARVACPTVTCYYTMCPR